jgi:hypothetical protein
MNPSMELICLGAVPQARPTRYAMSPNGFCLLYAQMLIDSIHTDESYHEGNSMILPKIHGLPYREDSRPYLIRLASGIQLH